MNIGLLTDSTSDLPKNLIEKYDIQIIPLNVNFGEDTYIDGVDITPEAFFDKTENSSIIPQTSMPSVGKFINKYQEMAKKYDAIISIHLSEGLSGTLNSAKMAAKQIKEAEIYPIDSSSISLGLGFQVLLAAKLIQAGESVNSIKTQLEQAKDNLFLYFTVEDLTYMKEGGRIGKAQAFIGGILKINPIISISTKTGQVEPLDKTRGKKRTMQKMLDIAKQKLKNSNSAWLGFAHGNRENDMVKFKDDLLEISNTQLNIETEIFTTRISATLGCHVGPSVFAGFILVRD
ncbi:MAG: DegV family protein [Bacillota bacterium]